MSTVLTVVAALLFILALKRRSLAFFLLSWTAIALAYAL